MRKGIHLLIPVFGFCSFVLLYIIAASLYPGGSHADRSSKGFSILHNYWCELLSSEAVNGAYNAGWRVAMAAMIILCVSLAIFWWQAPLLFPPNKWNNVFIGWAGVLSMAITPFLSSAYHDLVITLASIPGIIAMVATFVALYRQCWYKLVAFGIGCVLLIGANNYIYYTGHCIEALPLLQKVTFLLVMTWMSSIAWQVYKRTG